MAKDLGVGILGAGRVSRDHAYAATQAKGTRLVAVADPVEQRCRAYADRFGGEAHADFRELLSRDDVDLVLAGVPHGLHGSVGLEVLNAGKHLMIEKPMATTVEACVAMIDAAKKNGVRLMVGHTQHFFPANIAAKRLIESGEIGDPVMAAQWWYKPFGLDGRPAWMLNREQGGGMWLMNGAHMLDVLMWLIDSPVTSVKGNVTNTILQQEADDSVCAFLEFANGVSATLNHSGSKRPEPAPAEQWMTTQVIGTEGSARVVSYQGEAYVNCDGKDEPVSQERDAAREGAVAAFINEEAGNPAGMPLAQSAIEQTTGILNEVEAFADAILGDQDLPVGNQQALDVVRVMLAVEASSRSGREVRLDERQGA